MSQSTTFTVHPDVMLSGELVQPQPVLLCGPGPSNLTENVKRSLQLPALSPTSDEYAKIVTDIRHGIQYLFQTRSRAVFCASGAGHAAMETAIGNLVESGETVLVAVSGVWDDRICAMARRYGIIVEKLEKSPYEVYTPAEIEEGLRQYRPKALCIVQGDSSTGTLQPLDKLGEICERYDVLLLVDAIASCGGVPLFMDAWKIDGLYGSSQKVLSAPAGLSPVAFSDRAVKKLQSRKSPPPVFYFDANELMKQWCCYENTYYYHHTKSVAMMYAVRAALEDIAREGLQNFWERTARANNRFQERVSKLPVKFCVPKPEDRLPTVITILPPPNVSLGSVIKFFDDNGILINAGVGPTKDKALRFGFMGVNATDEIADKLADTLERALEYISSK